MSAFRRTLIVRRAFSQFWEWHLPPIRGFPGIWRRHQFTGPGAAEFRRIALAEGLVPASNGGNNARDWRVVPKRERKRAGRLTSN